MNKFKSIYRHFPQFIKDNKKDIIIVLILLTISGIAFGVNLFHFPYYQSDEGTYMSQAWSIMHGSIEPYTYWFDHAPLGWIFIALWVKLTGGFFTFGLSVNSGRVFMLVLHLISTVLIYFIAKKLTNGSRLAGIIACIIFSLSPLEIYYGRQVRIDTIMIFWVLVSFIILLKEKLNMKDIALSGLILGVATLSKENAIVFIPGLLYLIYKRSHKNNRIFSLITWITVSFSFISLYFLYAIVKGEFFPVGFLGNYTPHTSMLSTFAYMLSRGDGSSPFWNIHSQFMVNFIVWLRQDPYLMIGSTIAVLITFFIMKGNYMIKTLVLLTLFFLLYLIRGGIVLSYYVVPFIPILILNIAVVMNFIIKKISFDKKYLIFIFSFIFLSFSIVYLILPNISEFRQDQTSNQVKAIIWIKKHLNSNAKIAIGNYAYVDLHSPGFYNNKVFPYAEWFYKVIADPQIQDGIFHNDWRNIQYIFGNKRTELGVITGNFSNKDIYFLKEAFINSKVIKNFSKNTKSGWLGSIYKMDSKNQITLNQSFFYMISSFVNFNGKVSDPANNYSTTSQDQANLLLQSVYMNDHSEFSNVYNFTSSHLENRPGDKLFSKLWGLNNPYTPTYTPIKYNNQKYGILNSNTSSGADVNIALSLLLAYKKWGNISYLNDAKAIIKDIWKKEVVRINSKYYLTTGTNSKKLTGYLVNPGYLNLSAFRLFSQIDPEDQWSSLYNDSFYLLNEITPNGHLPPNEILVSNVGKVEYTSSYLPVYSNLYGFYAFRVFYNLALDAKWFNSTRSKVFLERYSKFFANQWSINQNIYTEYTLNSIPYF